MKFTNDQHKIWESLLEHQLPNVQKFACREFLSGLESIELPQTQIPSLEFLNSKITPKTGWSIRRTKTRYIDSIPWYQHFVRKEFVVTDFLRSWEEFEFTHEPDMFHDIFGHLPFHMISEYTELIELFAPAFLCATKQQQEDIKRLAWFSYEFGLIRQEGEIKVFGTGLLSSIGEIAQVTSGKTSILPFTTENVLKRNKAIYTFNKELFVFESIEALKREFRKYFDSILKAGQSKIQSSEKIVDRQMKLS